MTTTNKVILHDNDKQGDFASIETRFVENAEDPKDVKASGKVLLAFKKDRRRHFLRPPLRRKLYLLILKRRFLFGHQSRVAEPATKAVFTKFLQKTAEKIEVVVAPSNEGSAPKDSAHIKQVLPNVRLAPKVVVPWPKSLKKI
jgi:hypothetical protein